VTCSFIERVQGIEVGLVELAPRRAGLEAAMRGELSAILQTPEFRRSPVLSQLLRYLVNETLAGRGNLVKAYSVAVDALGRDPDFDAQADSYPRVQMGRLRRALELHYAHHASDQGATLVLEPGSYRVRLGGTERSHVILTPSHAVADRKPDLPAALIELITPPTTVERLSPETVIRFRSVWFRVAALIVFVIGLGYFLWADPVSFDPQVAGAERPVLHVRSTNMAGGQAVSATLLDGLSRSWITRLSVEEGPGVNVSQAGASDAFNLATQLVNTDRARNTLFLRLSDSRSGTLVWSGAVDVPKDNGNLADILAPVIAHIAGPYGVISNQQTRKYEGSKSGGFACLLKYLAFQKSHDPAAQKQVGTCLAKPVNDNVLVPVIFAARAFFTLESITPQTKREAAIATALDFAHKAIDADSKNAFAHFAMARIAFLANDCETGRRHTSLAVAANPYDPIVVAVLAGLMYQCGFAEAEPLLERAYLIRADGLSFARLPLILAAISQQRYDRVAALGEPENRDRTGSKTYYYLCETLVEAALDHNAKAKSNWALFVSASHGENKSVNDLLKGFVLSEPLRASVIAFLRSKQVVVA
jgi:hypothetical protein